MSDDTPRQDTTSRDRSPDELYSLSLDGVVDIFEEAGLPRTLRAIQRYCALGKLDSHKVETPTGEKYLVTPHSVQRLIKYIKEVSRPGATSHDNSRPDATVRTLEVKPEPEPRPTTTSTDQPRPVATTTTSDDRYVLLLENQVDFLRGQIEVKDKQIGELTERAREGNVLTAGLHKLLAPLLTSPENRNGEKPQQP